MEVLVLAPTGRDAELIVSSLMRESISARSYPDLKTLILALQKDPGVLLIAEEALSNAAVEQINKILAEQEAWSDIPIIVMTSAGAGAVGSLRVLKAFIPSGNVSLLERPFHQVTLLSTLQVALRARKRQFQVRELLELQKQATTIRDEFISIASHELKTPLTALKLQMQLTQKIDKRDGGLPGKRVTQLIETTGNQVDRLTRLVEDMLDISRITTGKLLIEKSDFELCELVVDIAERFRPQLEAVGSSLEIVTCPGFRGNWDRYRIEQVLNNLITNAIRYSPGKPVRVSVESSGGVARILVRDEGRGIAPENQERIFQRFERAVMSGSISGLGLGLYICRQIVEAHGGTIRVESKLGSGSTFIVELPIKESSEAQAEPSIQQQQL